MTATKQTCWCFFAYAVVSWIHMNGEALSKNIQSSARRIDQVYFFVGLCWNCKRVTAFFHRTTCRPSKSGHMHELNSNMMSKSLDKYAMAFAYGPSINHMNLNSIHRHFTISLSFSSYTRSRMLIKKNSYTIKYIAIKHGLGLHSIDEILTGTVSTGFAINLVNAF